MEPCLDTLPGLLKRLSLGDLCRVVGADTHDVGAGEDEDIGDQLQREMRTPVTGAPTVALPVPKHGAQPPAPILGNTHRLPANKCQGLLGVAECNWSGPLMSSKTKAWVGY